MNVKQIIKKPYISPELLVLEYVVESGYAASGVSVNGYSSGTWN